MNRLTLLTLCLLLLVGLGMPVHVVASDTHGGGGDDDSGGKKVIIFLPGMLGTELYEHPTDRSYDSLVWPDPFESSDLKFGNKLYVGVPFGWEGRFNPPDWLKSRMEYLYFYEKFQQYFEENDKYILEPFAYDFRFGNKYTSDQLALFVDTVKRKHSVEKVNLVAHSMGGLIAKKYILEYGGNYVDKFITIGTPFFGAPLAFQYFNTGYQVDILGIPHKMVSPTVAKTIPSLYELLPNTMYFSKSSYLSLVKDNKNIGTLIDNLDYWETKNLLGKYFSYGLLEEAEDFHETMTQSVSDKINGEFYRIIGYGYYTDIHYYVEEYWVARPGLPAGKRLRWQKAQAQGDGVVTINGAAPGETKTGYVIGQHDSLLKDMKTLNAIDAILNNRAIPLEKGPVPKSSVTFSIYNGNVYDGPIYTPQYKSLGSDSTLPKEDQMLQYLQRLNETPPLSVNIDLKHPDGSHFIVRNGQVISNPHHVSLDHMGSTIEIVADPGDYQLKVTSSDGQANPTVGLIVKSQDNNTVTKRHDFQNLDLSQGDMVALVSGDLTENIVGLDTNRDGTVDQRVEAEELPPLFEPVEIEYYDSPQETPPSQDPNFPGDSSEGEGSIIVELNGIEGRNRWFTTDVSINVSTDITIPEPQTENEGGADGSEGTEPDLDAEPFDPTPEIYLSVDGGAESVYTGGYTFGEDGEHTVTVYVKDREGNVLGEASKDFKIDKTKPDLRTLIAGMRGENGWLISDAQLSVGSEDETSKLLRVDRSLDSGALSEYSGPIDLTEEGQHSLYAEAQDNALNQEEKTEPFKIDKTKPWISDVYLQEEYFWNEEFPIRFQVRDGVSQVNEVRATINGKPVTNGATYRFTEPGWHTYRIEVKDFAGWRAVYEEQFEVYIPAKFNFDPDSLQLDHGTGMATAYVELPEPFAPDKMNFATAQLNGHVGHVQDEQYGYVQNPIGDEDANGILEMKFKYERESLVNVIPPGTPIEKPVEEQEADGVLSQAIASEMALNEEVVDVESNENGGINPSGDGNDNGKGNGNGTPPVWGTAPLTMFGEWDIYHFKGYDTIRVSNLGYQAPPPDVTPPTITADVTEGASGVSVDVSPVLTFSESVAQYGAELTDATVQGLIQLKDDKGMSVPFTANWMKNSRSMQINPVERLLGSHTYTVDVAAGVVMDAAGNGNEAFQLTFETEPYTVTFEAPLPLPMLEPEPEQSPGEGSAEEPGEVPSNPSPVTTPPPYVEPIPVVLEGAVSDAELSRALQTAEMTGKITLEASADESLVGLTAQQVTLLANQSKPLELKIGSTVYSLEANALQAAGVDFDQISRVTMGAEIVEEEEAQSLKEQAANSSKFRLMGEVFHFSAEAELKDGTKQAIPLFNGTVRVTLPLPEQAKQAAVDGFLSMGRFNVDTQQWDEYAVSYDAATGTFAFETDKFSNWTLLAKELVTFADVKAHWAQKDVEFMATHGYIKGVGDEQFSPETTVSRAEVAAILGRMLKLDEATDAPFRDVSANAWYADDVSRAYAAGLIRGVSADRFAPEKEVTREEMAVMIANALAYQGMAFEQSSDDVLAQFIDRLRIAEWAVSAAETLVQQGILHGKTAGNDRLFDPQGKATRAEAVVLLHHTMEYLK